MYSFLIIDNKMRKIEKDYLEALGYYLIEVPSSQKVYQEISSHTDIFVSKIKDYIIVEPSFYDCFINQLKKYNLYSFYRNNIIEADYYVQEKYPLDIAYNICTTGNYAIHNFKYTSKTILQILNKEKIQLIDVKQGYTNCSIAVIDDKSLITTDKGIYNKISKYNLDVLFVDNNLDIKLLKKDKYSDKKGFIGGCISRIDNKIIVTGDLNKIDTDKKIRYFIENKGLEIIEFKDLDVIDYGGIMHFEQNVCT